MRSLAPEWVVKLAGTARLPHAASSDVKTPTCLRQVVREHGRYVLGLLRHLGVARAEAEDVAQEVYLVVLAQLPTFEARTSFKAWLSGVCRHKAADYRRKRARRQMLANARPVELPPEGECPQGRLLQQEEKEVLRRALTRLSDEQLEVFVLHLVEELPMKT